MIYAYALPVAIAPIVWWMRIVGAVFADALAPQPMLEDDLVMRSIVGAKHVPWELSLVLMVIAGVLVTP